MYEIHLWMLFVVAVFAMMGTFGGIATQYAAIINFFAWMVLGMAIPSTTIAFGDGSTAVVGSSATGFTYLAYIIAIGGWVPWFVTIYEWYTEETSNLSKHDADQLEDLMNVD